MLIHGPTESFEPVEVIEANASAVADFLSPLSGLGKRRPKPTITVSEFRADERVNKVIINITSDYVSFFSLSHTTTVFYFIYGKRKLNLYFI
jgi:hypothetical protein